MFLTDQQILNSVADLLKYSAASLPAYWTNIVTEQHAAAYNYLLGKLLNRGFLLSQIQQWDQGPYYERQLSIFFVITDAAATDSFNSQSLMLRDVRKELDTVLLSVNGAFVQPGATGDEPGTVGYGAQENDCDIFPWPNREYLRRERW